MMIVMTINAIYDHYDDVDDYVVNLVLQALMICVCDYEYSHKHW